MLRVIGWFVGTSCSSGNVEIDGTPWLDTRVGLDLPAEQRQRGFLFQDYALFPRMNGRNVADGMSEGRAERRAAAVAMLERFGIGELADATYLSLAASASVLRWRGRSRARPRALGAD